MQTTVDIPDTDLQALTALAQARNLTPQALIQDLIRQAVTTLLTTEPPQPRITRQPGRPFPGFGLWADREDIKDGLEYQIAIRKEWDREWDPD